MAAATILMLVVLAQESVESLLTRAVLADRDGRLEEAAPSSREAPAAPRPRAASDPGVRPPARARPLSPRRVLRSGKRLEPDGKDGGGPGPTRAVQERARRGGAGRRRGEGRAHRLRPRG